MEESEPVTVAVFQFDQQKKEPSNKKSPNKLNQFVEEQKKLFDEKVQLENKIKQLKKELSSKWEKQHKLGENFTKEAGISPVKLISKCHLQFYQAPSGDLYRIEIDGDYYFSFEPANCIGKTDSD